VQIGLAAEDGAAGTERRKHQQHVGAAGRADKRNHGSAKRERNGDRHDPAFVQKAADNKSACDAPRLHEVEEQYRKGPFAGRKNIAVTAICGQVEAELAELKPEEAKEYLSSYGLTDSGLERLISATYSLLGLMSFLTAGETEVRAWTIPMNSTAVKAAGAIHSDFEKKFIRAEVVNWKSLIDLHGYPGVKEKGLLRLEGKEYIVKDGDVLVIRHG